MYDKYLIIYIFSFLTAIVCFLIIMFLNKNLPRFSLEINYDDEEEEVWIYSGRFSSVYAAKMCGFGSPLPKFRVVDTKLNKILYKLTFDEYFIYEFSVEGGRDQVRRTPWAGPFGQFISFYQENMAISRIIEKKDYVNWKKEGF